MSSINSPSSAVIRHEDERFFLWRSLSWGAVFAGTAAGLAVHLLVAMLGTAMGLGTADPITEDNPVATFGAKAALVWTISALIALGVGGWVAGWFAPRPHKWSGCLHGLLVWSLATIGVLALLGTGTGAAIGGAASIAGQGIALVGKPLAGAASAVTDVAKSVAENNSEAIESYLEEAVSTAQAAGRNFNQARARREIGAALSSLFGEGRDPTSTEARTTVSRALVQNAGLSQADADRLVNEWADSYARLRERWEEAKQKAEQMARETADRASRAVAKAAAWSFIGFLVGAAAASMGGKMGANCSLRHADTTVVTRTTPTR